MIDPSTMVSPICYNCKHWDTTNAGHGYGGYVTGVCKAKGSPNKNDYVISIGYCKKHERNDNNEKN